MEKGQLKLLLESTKPDDKKKTEAVLHRILAMYLSDRRDPFRHRYELENFSSKNIERMLTLLENSMSYIRKLALLVIGLVLTNSNSKIFFLEKCGLSLIISKTFFTRLKYLYNFSRSPEHALQNLQSVTSRLRTVKPLDNDALFWHIPLKTSKGKMPRGYRPEIFEFRIKDMINEEGKIDLANVPDPVYNICGVEFTEADRDYKIRTHKQPRGAFKFSASYHVPKPSQKSSQPGWPRDKKGSTHFNHSTQSTITQTNSRGYLPKSQHAGGTYKKRGSAIGYPNSKPKTKMIRYSANTSYRKPVTVKQPRRTHKALSQTGVPMKQYKSKPVTGDYRRKTGFAVKAAKLVSMKGTPRRKTYNFGTGMISSVHDIGKSDRERETMRQGGDKKNLYHSGIYGRRQIDPYLRLGTGRAKAPKRAYGQD